MQIEKLTKREQLILDFLKDNDVDIEEVIDAIIKANRYEGVGLVRLQDIMIDAVKNNFKQGVFVYQIKLLQLNRITTK